MLKSPNFGCSELRSAIAAYLARSRGFAVQPAQVIIGSGAEYLYGLIVQLLGRERLYALENPSYEKIRRVYRAQGVSCDFLMQDSLHNAALISPPTLSEKNQFLLREIANLLQEQNS